MANIQQAITSKNEQFSIDELHNLRINDIDKWLLVEKDLHCIVCNISLEFVNRSSGSNEYFRHLKNQNHKLDCPYYRVNGIRSGTHRSTTQGSLSEHDKKTRIARAIKSMQPVKKKTIKKTPSKPRASKKVSNSDTATNAVDIIALTQNGATLDPTQSGHVHITNSRGGLVTEKDLGKSKIFMGYINSINIDTNIAANPVTMEISATIGARNTGTIVFRPDLFSNDINMVNNFRLLKNYVDNPEHESPIIGGLVSIERQVSNDIVGAIYEYNEFYLNNMVQLITYLQKVGEIKLDDI